MEERLRMMFREEMSAEHQPPVDGLIEDAVRGGRRARRTRRTWIGLGSTGALAALAGVAFVAAPGGAPVTPAATATAVPMPPMPLLAASSTSTVIKQPAGPKSPVTDAAVVEQLQRLLTKGKSSARTSGYAQGPKERERNLAAMGQIYLDAGKGPGMVRAFVFKGGLGCAPPKRMVKRPVCQDLPDGGRAVVTRSPNGATQASVDHGDGVVVTVFTTDWLAWNGRTNPPGGIAIPAEQVLTIAAYRGWGLTMDSALVKKAAADHPSLPVVS